MANPEDLGRYRLKRLLGRGVLGEVWEANDLEQAGSKVAVKIMHAADDELAFARSHFAREGRLAALLRHPNVAAVHDAGEAAGTSFLVMEMVEGRSLRSLLKEERSAPGTLALQDKLRWLCEVGHGLAAMHRAGVVHRDLKPENVIVRDDRSACLVDLGIAKWTKFDLGGERDPENEFEAIETPPPISDYAPPETTELEVYDELGDQYAWGVLAYEVLTGEVPRLGSEPLASRSEVPAAFAAVVDRARSADREARWDGMEVVLGELGLEAPTSKTSLPVAAGTVTPPVRSSPLPPPPDGSKLASLLPRRGSLPAGTESDARAASRLWLALGVVLVAAILAGLAASLR